MRFSPLPVFLGLALLALAACGRQEPSGLAPAKGEGMPELAQDAPLFDELGAKYNEAFLAHWINDPHTIRPHSLMPHELALAHHCHQQLASARRRIEIDLRRLPRRGALRAPPLPQGQRREPGAGARDRGRRC